MRLNEVHPIMTHYAMTLFPVAVGIDAAAWLTDNSQLERLGRVVMPVATATAGVTAASGLMAEQQVRGSKRAEAMLSQHRSINLVAGGAMVAMSAYRISRRRPAWGYILAGVGVFGALAYSGYLGGRMVYGEGMGVEKAGGLKLEESPELKPGNFVDALVLAGRQIRRSVTGLVKRLMPGGRGYGPDPEQLQRQIEVDNAGPGALPLGSAQRPIR